jgi:2-phosphosulfolactate phosphatase
MEFRRATLETCGEVTGTAIVIDVLRAFSTAAYAFAAGASAIAIVSTIEEAFALKKQKPGALIMGEVAGMPVRGFDFSNSPVEFDKLDLSGRFLIQHTSAGTQGVALSRQASHIFACGFCCISATARCILALSPKTISFVVTGLGSNGEGDEDAACADYLEILLRGGKPDCDPFIQRVYGSKAARRFTDSIYTDFRKADLEFCTRIDRFDFALYVKRCDGLLLMEKLKCPEYYEHLLA